MVGAMSLTGVPELFSWSPWQPLLGSSRNREIPASPGLYRVRVAGTGEVVYIGQTGNSLRGRLGMLSTCHGADMPYRAPHTAAPTLWSLRHRDGVEFEVSTAVIESTKVERLALEAVAISAHRVAHGRSPLANFGGSIAGYRLSSSNDAGLVASGKRFRGGPDPLARASVSAAVSGPLDGDVTAADWLGFQWSSWVPFDEAPAVDAVGLYRLSQPEASDLLYVGQGRIGDRIRSHRAKRVSAGHRQASHFAGDVVVSWTTLDVDRRILLEYENDAIASHQLVHGTAPRAQFIG
jgi:hypothetical protein